MIEFEVEEFLEQVGADLEGQAVEVDDDSSVETAEDK
eukprot:CAMPEP_0172523204 /NCGR_PEP_ID=MMETSP1066-20121228/293537_1 /TAXON_ID=671091 /ORGANISM="Coscinodiscus wailesii, Strain CCMP2513" /LENGTH=36 /DNA_ID= /DNA_START= /DNA_END= /DNA_ORIENTATION=